MVKKISGAEMIVETIIKNGASHGFGITGGSVIPTFEKFLEYEKEFTHLLVRHEQGAVHAADGYARASGKPGICFATSGPGATNLVTGIMNAFMDSVPVIAFGGQVSRPLLGNDAFQETDMLGITMPITKHNFALMAVDEINNTINKAFKIATSGRPGPVYIDIPLDVQKDKTNASFSSKTEVTGLKIADKGNLHQIKKAAEAILNAEKPVIVAGGGVMISKAFDQLKKFVETTGIPITTTMMGKTCFPESHPLCLGILGMHGRKSANYAMINTDLIIAVGCRFSDRITGNLESFGEKAKVIHIDIDPAEIGKNVKADIPIVGDANSVLRDLNKVINTLSGKKKHENSEWNKRMKKFIKECNCDQSECKAIHPKNIVLALNKILGENDIVTTGVGQHQMFAMHFLKRDKPRTFISSGGAGTMGFGLPSAIGAKTAKPDVEVIDIDGDGSFQMNIQELGTIAENNIKLIPVIFNNTYLGMVRQWLEIFFDRKYSNVYLGKLPDYGKIADAYGLNSVEINRESEFKPAMEKAMKSKETTIVDVHIDPESNILPMFPGGGHLKDIFGDCMKDKGKFF